MIKDLYQFVESIKDHSDIQPLPLCHTTKAINMWAIMDTREMIPVPKKMADEEPEEQEDANYFFYGQAQYYEEADTKGIINNNFPVCLIFHDHDLLEQNLIALMPFDSGGMPKYNIDKSLKKKHFKIKPVALDSVRKYIKGFFGSIEKYFEAEVSETISDRDYKFCMPIQALKQLYENSKNNDTNYDYRYATIEIQCSYLKNVFPDCLVLPMGFLCDRHSNEQKMTAGQLAKELTKTYKVGSLKVKIYPTSGNCVSYKSPDGLSVIYNLNHSVKNYVRKYIKKSTKKATPGNDC